MTSTATVWVCLDCHYTHHGLNEDYIPYQTPDREPWGLIEDTTEVTSGCFPGQCHGGEGHKSIEDCEADDYECTRTEFTWSSCDACGSDLGGIREVYTLWYRED